MSVGVRPVCGNCAHFRQGAHGLFGGGGTCWRYPPRFSDSGCRCGAPLEGRPRVHADSYCGEFTVLVEARALAERED